MTRSLLTLLLLCFTAPLALGADQASLVRSSARNEEVTLSFSSPIVYRVERFSKPARLVVSLYSVSSSAASRDIHRLRSPWIKSARSETLLGDSMRVTLYLMDDFQVDVYGVPPTDSIILARNRKTSEAPSRWVHEVQPKEGRPAASSNPAPSNSNPRPFVDPVLNTPRPTPAAPSAPAKPEERFGIQVTRMDFQHSDEECQLHLDLTEPIQPQAFLLLTDPRKPRMVMDLPNARLIPAEQTIAVPENPLVRQLRVGVFEHKGSRVVLDLKRKVGFKITSDKETGRVVLSLSPNGPAGDNPLPWPGEDTKGEFGGVAPSLDGTGLEGRTIVIDAGHGGHDSGTSGHGQVEKHLALDISKRLQTLLRNAGGNAVMTRSDDRFLRLPDRPSVANRMGADAFLAIHLNSTGSKRNIWSGTETYYHFQDPICRELAQHIQANLVQAIGLPDRGAKSDTRIAPKSGFSVLRNAKVPAVLIEVGYLNHPGDAAKLSNPAFRQRAAEGIMAGLRSYFSRNQQSARRR